MGVGRLRPAPFRSFSGQRPHDPAWGRMAMALRFAGFRTKPRKVKPFKARRIARRLRGPELLRLIEIIEARRLADPATPPLAITCRGRIDGAGAQALGIISALLLADATGCRYFHSPFATMAHAPGDRAAWAAQWERFLNLGRGEARVPPRARLIPAIDLVRDPTACDRPDSVLAASYYHWAGFQTPEALDRLSRRLRRKYQGSRKSAIPSHRGPPGSLTAAIHVRRGDVTADHPVLRRFYTQDEPILETMRAIRSAARRLGRDVHVNLYSEGPEEMFRAFAAAGCRLRLDSDAFTAFHNLVRADILVQAKSSFSYVAGLISTGAVLHERYVTDESGAAFYRPAPAWIVRDDAGGFQEEALCRFVESRQAPESWLTRPLRPLRRLSQPAG